MIAARLSLFPLAALLLGAAPALRPAGEAGVGADMAAPLEDALPGPEVNEDPWAQVRIMQRFMVRITPGPPMPPPVAFEMDQQDTGSRYEERKIGKCLAVGQIAAVQSTRSNRLLLFLRDQRIVSAGLEKACKASEFYSGFYMARSVDGQLCLDRDTLQSRSGAACKVKRWKVLVASD
ncbi:MAG: hypothetical protein KGN34_11925 [Sphingomonadales bacterium]|nr:hypothetical protein [Sphingomonadales bacterium]